LIVAGNLPKRPETMLLYSAPGHFTPAARIAPAGQRMKAAVTVLAWFIATVHCSGTPGLGVQPTQLPR